MPLGPSCICITMYVWRWWIRYAQYVWPCLSTGPITYTADCCAGQKLSSRCIDCQCLIAVGQRTS
jgi:hypothetical protein